MILEQKNYRAFFLFASLLLTLTFLCHGLALRAQFMIDDFSYTANGQNTISYKKISDFFLIKNGNHFSPLDIFLNIQLFKLFPKPAYLYAVNLLLFYGSTILLFFLVKRLTRNFEIAALTAILFASHPVNAEILSHIASINTVLISALLLQSSMMLFWKYQAQENAKSRWFLLSLATFTVSLFCIETALLFPACLGCLCCLPACQQRFRALRLTIPFWVIAILYLIFWWLLAGSQGAWNNKVQYLDLTFLSYTATLGYLLKWYIGNLIIPMNFVLIQSSVPITSSILLWNTGLVATIGLIVLLMWQWRKTPKCFALGWFVIGFAFILPASISHALSMRMVIEPHWFYFSSMGFFLLIALILYHLKKNIHHTLTSH